MAFPATGRPRTSEPPFLIGDDGFIPLAGDKGIAVVDAADWHRLKHIPWHLASNYAAFNSGATAPRVTLQLHRVVLGLEHGDCRLADHINGDTLDCRRGNLRIANSRGNNLNRRARTDRRFKGAYPSRGRWFSRIQLENGHKHLGMFDTEEAAARAYDRAARIAYGEFAKLNFSDSRN